MSNVATERTGHVLLITLNRPDVHNAVNEAMSAELGAALDIADKDDRIRAVVITGSGQRAFCAGADMKDAARSPEGLMAATLQPGGFARYTNNLISTPTIAAVNGIALGGGTEIVLASDLAVAAEHAIFGLPEVAYGIYAGGGGAFRLPRQIPPKFAMEAILTGRTFTAEDALRWGLVNRVVEASALLTNALSLAEQIASHPPMAVQASKRIARGIVSGIARDEEEAWRLSNDEGRRVLTSDDAREGLSAFREKRAPQWG